MPTYEPSAVDEEAWEQTDGSSIFVKGFQSKLKALSVEVRWV